MTPVSDEARNLLETLIKALEAMPAERRSFCIPRFNGPVVVVMHKGLAGGHLEISRGLLDEMTQAAFLRKVEPLDKKNCLYDLTADAYAYRVARAPASRAAAVGRSGWKAVAAVLAALAALVGILLVGPPTARLTRPRLRCARLLEVLESTPTKSVGNPGGPRSIGHRGPRSPCGFVSASATPGGREPGFPPATG